MSSTVPSAVFAVPPVSAPNRVARGGAAPPAPPVTQVVREASMRLAAKPGDAFRWFGPVAEREWAGPDWQPRFVHPLPEADVEGAVFTTAAHGVPGETTTWVNVRFDPGAGVAEYVHFTAGLLVTRITVTVCDDGAGGSAVHVRYVWTPLSPAGEASFTDRAARFEGWIGEWQAALGPVLAASAAGA